MNPQRNRDNAKEDVMRSVLNELRGPPGVVALMIMVAIASAVTEFELLSEGRRGIGDWAPDEIISLLMVMSLALPIVALLSRHRILEQAHRKTAEAEAEAEAEAHHIAFHDCLPSLRCSHQHVEKTVAQSDLHHREDYLMANPFVQQESIK